MVRSCDRLLQLLTGPQAITDPAAIEAALEAIELLRVLEGYLKGAGERFAISAATFDNLEHRTAVLGHIADVVAELREQRLCA